MRIAQISDTHISLDFPARQSDLERCVAQINALRPRPDVVIHTGDISHDGLSEQYEIARNLLQKLEVPWFVLAGNRDKRQPLIKAFSQCGIPRASFPFVQYAVDEFAVRLVCVDTHSDASNKGELCPDRLDDLERLINAEPDRPTAIFMHHPPFDVPVAPDPFQFVSRENADVFWKIVAFHGSVRGVFCGHVHRRAAARIGSVPVRVMTAVALDLRMGKQEPNAIHAPLFELHEIDATTTGNACRANL
jgi:3',5'-cyclic AMP phosphodiesterase CpdA